MPRGYFFDICNKTDFGPLTERWVRARWVRWLVPVLYALSALAFVSDICRDDLLAYGIIYVPLVATSVCHKRGIGLWLLTTAACVLVVVGAVVPPVNPDLPDLIGNRVLSILAILATAIFVRYARMTQEHLAAETHRAEAAERVKSEVLTNLSQELRMPMHVLLSIIGLMTANCRPDQLEALGRLRAGGKQLLDTINNLIDLTQIDDRQLERRTIDVAAIARDVVASASASASERQIGVVADGLTSVMALGDAWATRRVLDNLLANAIRSTPPGGLVSLSVDRSADMVSASVSDGGEGIPFEATCHFRDDAADLYGSTLPANGGTGLALSNRLARTMSGWLSVRPAPGSEMSGLGTSGLGATVSLFLPAG